MRIFKMIMRKVFLGVAIVIVVLQGLFFLFLLAKTIPFWPNADKFRIIYSAAMCFALILLIGVPAIYVCKEKIPLEWKKHVTIIWSVEFVVVIFLGLTGISTKRFINRIMDCKNCDYSLAGFHLMENGFSDSDVVNLLGEGCKVKTPDWYSGVQRFYLFPGVPICGIFNSARGFPSIALCQIRSNAECLDPKIEMEIQSIPLNMRKDCFSKKGLSAYATGRKLALGDSIQKTLMLYGRPTFKVKKNFHNILYSYQRSKTPVAEMQVFFEDNVIVSIVVERHEMQLLYSKAKTEQLKK